MSRRSVGAHVSLEIKALAFFLHNFHEFSAFPKMEALNPDAAQTSPSAAAAAAADMVKNC